mmetsp:Transcript_11299/g.21165  ORF Transcript_11299/g.21165 Transcript_11299/m.21165 type:complete len:189 (+) Transcript_11299:490-1056(+)
MVSVAGAVGYSLAAGIGATPFFATFLDFFFFFLSKKTKAPQAAQVQHSSETITSQNTQEPEDFAAELPPLDEPLDEEFVAVPSSSVATLGATALADNAGAEKFGTDAGTVVVMAVASWFFFTEPWMKTPPSARPAAAAVPPTTPIAICAPWLNPDGGVSVTVSPATAPGGGVPVTVTPGVTVTVPVHP